MKKYKIAAVLMIIHGGFMELGGIFAMIPALLIGTDKYDIGQYFEFKLPYFEENLHMMMFLLPAGIMDGILAGSALILILMQYFGDKKIVE